MCTPAREPVLRARSRPAGETRVELELVPVPQTTGAGYRTVMRGDAPQHGPGRLVPYPDGNIREAVPRCRGRSRVAGPTRERLVRRPSDEASNRTPALRCSPGSGQSGPSGSRARLFLGPPRGRVSRGTERVRPAGSGAPSVAGHIAGPVTHGRRRAETVARGRARDVMGRVPAAQ